MSVARIIEVSISPQAGKQLYILDAPPNTRVSIYARDHLIRISYWVSDTTSYTKRAFIVLKTGDSLPIGQAVKDNIGSVILDSQVYHVFEGYNQ